MKKKNIKFNEAINRTLHQEMRKNPKTVYFGLGADDNDRIFNTTNKLVEKFNEHRVFDTPVSENAMMGVAVGMSLNGLVPIISHQRLDFFLLAMDQLVNSASKWNFMFGNKNRINLTIRLIVGKGWGQGPTHSQNLQSWFAHVPGLKVITPSLPSNASALLSESIRDPSPVIFIEHRWCHQLKETENSFKKNKNKFKIGKCNFLSKGKDLTIITSSYSTIEFLKCYSLLKKFGVSFDHIDLLSLKPIDLKSITRSVKKTRRLLILDNTSHEICSIGSEIVSKLIQQDNSIFKSEPILLQLPDVHQPTSYHLTKSYFISRRKIILSILKLLNKKHKNFSINENLHHDIIDDKKIFYF